MSGELVLAVAGVVTLPEGWILGYLSSLVSVGAMLYGGYWLSASDLTADNYMRFAGWTLAGTVLFVLINVGFMQYYAPETAFQTVGWLRWAASFGGGIGVVIGLFEVKAIERAVEVRQSRLREEQLQDERDRLDEFVGIVSHDLRNPLSVASTRLVLAQEECDSEHLDDVAEALDRMDALIEDLLVLARQGETAQNPEPVELETVFRRCWANVETKEGSPVVTTDRTGLADEGRLRQLFENLVRNAVEHGGTDVTVTLGDLDDGFYLEDDGSGIPEEIRGNIFEVGHSTNESGTGFGLSIVRQIAQAHDWDINVTESGAGGTRFEITGVTFIDT